MKLYKQLNKNERFFIDHCLNVEHLSMRSIANMLGRNVTTISREIKRNSELCCKKWAFFTRNYLQNLTSKFTSF